MPKLSFLIEIAPTDGEGVAISSTNWWPVLPPTTVMQRLIGDRPLATKSGNYCPDARDFIWIDLDPTVGHEQSGRRPAIVLLARNYNSVAGLCVVCPILSRVRDYPFEAKLPDSASIRGVVLADQPRGIFWEKRAFRHAGRTPDRVLTDVRERLAALLGID